jgi:hypothetical protein
MLTFPRRSDLSGRFPPCWPAARVSSALWAKPMGDTLLGCRGLRAWPRQQRILAGRSSRPGRALGIFALRSLKSCPQVLGRYRPSQPACRFLNGRSAFFWRGTGAQYAFRARGAGQGPFTAAPGFSRGQAVPFRHVAALGFSSSRSSDATATSTVAARRPGLVTWAGHRPRDSASGPCRS